MPIKDIRDENFEEEILKARSALTLVDFWATWCAPCKAIMPLIEELSQKYEGKVSFAKINVEDNPKTSSQFKVFSIPNLILFKGGKVFAQLVGRTSRKDIESLILSGLSEARAGHS